MNNRAAVLCFTVIFLLASSTHGRPQSGDSGTAQHSDSSETTPVPILSQTEVIGTDGSFNFSYETGNGIHYQESGYVKPNLKSRSGEQNEDGTDEESSIQVIEGSYSYTAPDGQVISLKFIADENGFQPEGEHLPTPPPLPESVQRTLDEIKASAGSETSEQEPQQALDGQSSAFSAIDIIHP